MLIYILTIFVITGSLTAQQPGNREKIEASKIGFISQRLELTPNQAQTFWPMYNEYAAKK